MRHYFLLFGFFLPVRISDDLSMGGQLRGREWKFPDLPRGGNPGGHYGLFVSNYLLLKVKKHVSLNERKCRGPCR